jgi:hypothetical protein
MVSLTHSIDILSNIAYNNDSLEIIPGVYTAITWKCKPLKLHCN